MSFKGNFHIEKILPTGLAAFPPSQADTAQLQRNSLIRAADPGRPHQRISMLEAALGCAAMSAAGAAPPKRDRLEEFALGLQAPSGPILDPLDALLDANSRAGPPSAAGARQGTPFCVSNCLCRLNNCSKPRAQPR